MERKQLRNFRKLLWGVGAVFLAGAFLSFVFLAKTPQTHQAILIGYCYALCLGVAIWLVQRLIISRLTVFSAPQQWLLKTLVYTIAISTAYLTGLVFQTILLLPAESLSQFAFDHLWKALVFVASLPFSRETSETILTPQSRSVLISFFAVLFLIGLVSMVGSFVELRWQESRRKQAVERAELTALRAQIEPHFLFNSLNTIASLIRKNPAQAEKVLLQLSDILRYLFQNSSREAIELSREIEFTRQYIALLQARFEKNLQVQWQQSLQHDSHYVPALLLQPVIENAVRHGWPENGAALSIDVNIAENENNISVVIKDNGKGISPEKLKKLPLPGHALENISERLYLLFKKRDLLKITSTEGSGTRVEIIIPKSTKPATRNSNREGLIPTNIQG